MRIFLIAAAALSAVLFYGCQSEPKETVCPNVPPTVIGTGDDSYGVYNPENVFETGGTILKVTEFDANGPKSRLDFTIKSTLGEEYLVHTGPVAYMKNLGANFKVGDSVTVVGSTVVFNGKTRIIAAKIKDGSKKFIIRDSKGIALWPQGGKLDGTTKDKLKLAK
jgi:hypothetical protein